MLEISPLVWGVTIGLVVVLLAVDLAYAALRPHKVGFKEAAGQSIFYVAIAIGFGVWFTFAYGVTRARSTSPATWWRRACRSTTCSSSSSS
jgi:uncharacterized membrane protein